MPTRLVVRALAAVIATTAVATPLAAAVSAAPRPRHLATAARAVAFTAPAANLPNAVVASPVVASPVVASPVVASSVVASSVVASPVVASPPPPARIAAEPSGLRRGMRFQQAAGTGLSGPLVPLSRVGRPKMGVGAPKTLFPYRSPDDGLRRRIGMGPA
jgi:hypothetical protein